MTNEGFRELISFLTFSLFNETSVFHLLISNKVGIAVATIMNNPLHYTVQVCIVNI